MQEIVHIPFSVSDGVFTLNDALNLTQQQIDELGDDGLEAMKQQRFDNWIAIIKAPPVEEPVAEVPMTEIPTE